MARMIPASISPECKSGGEREIFRRLRDSKETSDWIILHSLDVASHRKQVSGEIDFLIIIPSKGVLCVEVKACSRLRRAEGLWYYGTDRNPDARGPFRQASDSMHSLRLKLLERRPDLSNVVFWSAVVFPYVPFPAKSDEWHDWQVIDLPKFRTQPLGTLLEGVLNDAREFLASCPNAIWFHPQSREPYPEQCQAIAEALRPSFEYYESPKSRVLRLNEELKHYTEEQYAALDAMESNPRVVFRGPAGTGKTLLAIEAVRRSQAADHRVLFVCYNRLLGGWLRDQTHDMGHGAVVKTLHQHMLTVSGLTPPADDAVDRSFWEDDLPYSAMERLVEDGSSDYLFDELVIDEAQDILRGSYLDFLDLSLKGGLSAGRWRLFGDFEKQAIYQSSSLSLEDFLVNRNLSVPIYSLRTNCRNAPRVAGLAHLLGGLAPDYTRILRPDNGIEPELHYYRDEESQYQLLVEVLASLFGEGYSGADIVVLSPRADDKSAAGRLVAKPWADRLRPAKSATGGHIRYGSVSAFKGMEAPAVVMTDVSQVSGAESEALLYIGVTRALQKLVVLADESSKHQVVHVLLGGSYS